MGSQQIIFKHWDVQRVRGPIGPAMRSAIRNFQPRFLVSQGAFFAVCSQTPSIPHPISYHPS